MTTSELKDQREAMENLTNSINDTSEAFKNLSDAARIQLLRARAVSQSRSAVDITVTEKSKTKTYDIGYSVNPLTGLA